MLDDDERRIAKKLLDVVLALTKDRGKTTVKRLMALHPTDFRSIQDATKTLQEMKAMGFIEHFGKTPSIWRWTQDGREKWKKFVEEAPQ